MNGKVGSNPTLRLKNEEMFTMKGGIGIKKALASIFSRRQREAPT